MARPTDRIDAPPRGTAVRPEPDYADVREEPTRLPFARDRVRWGPIVAGLVTAMAALVVFTVLGVAIGLSAFEPDETGVSTLGTAAGIWGAATALVAFLLGGLVAGMTAGVRAPGSGVLNGFLVGAGAIVLTVLLVGSGIGNLLGAAAANLGDLSAVNTDLTGDEAVTAFAQAEEGAWWTLVGLAATLAAAAIGGWIGELTGMAPRREPRPER